MAKYKYRFCDGKTSEVDITDEQYMLLKQLDEQECQNNLHHKRQSIPLVYCSNIAATDSLDEILESED